ncbi:MAG: 50S ribosomal protein L4 [Acidimicrobiales bacterium]
MTSIDVKTAAGKKAGTADLDDQIFGIEPNLPVMHQVVTAQLAARRAGTHSTKTRAERRGGGAKPWRQKGTGRARQGSIRSPQWRGGGIAHGPKPRDYSQRTPKKMIKLALRSALSDRAADGKVIVVDKFGFDAPKTADAVKALSALGAEGRVLLVLNEADANAALSFRNLPEVHVLPTGELNAYDVLVSDTVVFTKDALPTSAAPALAEASADEEAAPAAAVAEEEE